MASFTETKVVGVDSTFKNGLFDNICAVAESFKGWVNSLEAGDDWGCEFGISSKCCDDRADESRRAEDNEENPPATFSLDSG